MQKQLQYAAGLFDGRGTFTLWKPSKQTWKHTYVRITAGPKKYPILDWLHETFGGCISNVDKEGRKYWCIQAKKAERFLTAIRPYSKLAYRRKQIDYILNKPMFAAGCQPTKAEIKVRKDYEKGWKKQLKKNV